MAEKRGRKFWFRALLALISSIVLTAMLFHTAGQYLTTPGLSIRKFEFIKQHFTERKTIIPSVRYNDLTDGGMQANLTLSNNLFQIVLLVTLGLAGLLIARDEAKFVFGGGPEMVMFISAGLLLVLSFVSHVLYLKEVSYLYFYGGRRLDLSNPFTPDISDENVNFLLTYQLEYLLCGIVIAAFTFLSAHKLKGGKIKCGL